MRKIFFLILTLNPVLLHAYPQPRTIKFGINLGSTISHIDLTRDEKKLEREYYSQRPFPKKPWFLAKPKERFRSDSIRQYHIGIFFSHLFRKQLDIRWEVLYTGKGGRQVYTDPLNFKPKDITLPLSSIISLKYILAAIRLIISPGRIDRTHPKNLFYIGGLYMAYMLGAKQYKSLEARNGEKVHITKNLLKKSNKHKLRRFDLGFTMGAGYEFDIGLITSVTISLGVITLLKNTRGLNLDSHFSIGYNFAKML